jgi:protein SCO1/2
MRWYLAVIAAAWTTGASAQTPPLFTKLTEGPLAPFALKDQTGAPFTPEQLRGKVWIAHFFFTTCTQGCDKTVGRMRDIQEAVRGKNDIALVSISVNPENDDVNLLADYARDLGAEPGQWFFLTSPEVDVRAMVQKTFFVNAQANPSAPKGQDVTHDFRLLVVDRDGQIVGFTDGRDPANVPLLVDRVRRLASERYVLPAVNAALNATAGFLLIVGYLAIRRRNINLHKTAMLSALLCSGVFLGCYLYYHFMILSGQSPRLVGPGAVRIIYLTILLSHTLLAVVVAPLALFTTYQGLTDNLARHVRLARWTLPIWLYVSITGVVVYAMLYHLYPPY